MSFSKIIISALSGGSGKTILSIGIIAAWRELNKKIAPFKKGPDYIDAGWLALAAGRPCYNLDSFFLEDSQILNSFISHTNSGDIAVIEGNRGLYDGLDVQGSTSTAELAKLLDIPVILILDCTKSTRTMAATLLGCIKFDKDVKIKGVLLNRVAGTRHEKILRSSIERYCKVPVVGAIPKLGKQNFPERHMGLIPTAEHSWALESISAAAKIAKTHMDLDALEKIAKTDIKAERKKPAYEVNLHLNKTGDKTFHAMPGDFKEKVKIGILKDSAFQFYYPENIEALTLLGAEIIFLSPLSDKTLPQIDALYIGGGFPETHAAELEKNKNFKNRIKSLAEDGLPIYAECGGLMYLGDKLIMAEKTYKMSGVLPIEFGLSEKPQGHGYTMVNVEEDNPFFKKGTKIKGHEFHYSKVLHWGGANKSGEPKLVFSMKRGAGFINKQDGVCYKNVLATYTHIHALGTPAWAVAMVRNAKAYHIKKGM